MTNSTGQTVQTLWIKNGGKYTSKTFHDFCSSKGITRELTPPHTPQQNGIAKRQNWSLLDITRCLPLDKTFYGHLWGETVKAASDILNLRFTKQHLDKTSNEFFLVRNHPLLISEFLALLLLLIFPNPLGLS